MKQSKDKLINDAVERFLWNPCDETIEAVLSKIKYSHFYQSFHVIGMDKEDLRQLTRIGAWVALETYDPNRGSYLNFAKLCARRMIISAIEGHGSYHRPLNKACKDGIVVGRSGHRFCEDSPWEDGLFDTPEFPLRSYDPEEETDFQDIKEQKIRWIRQNLTQRECRAILCRIDGKSYEEISKRYHTNPKSIDNAIQRARKKTHQSIIME